MTSEQSENLADGEAPAGVRMSSKFKLRAAGVADAEEIVALGRQEFGFARMPSIATVSNETTTWTSRKTPTIVARDKSGRFLGFAYSKPNEAFDEMRPSGQVAVLAQVAVTPDARGTGVGTALVERSIRTLRMLGFQSLQAQMQESVVSWYQRLGWTVHGKNELKAWIEPHIAQDDATHPELPPGTFSPLLFAFLLTDYPYLGELQIGEQRPLVDAIFAAGRNDDETAQNAMSAILAALRSTPAHINLVPPALAGLLSRTPAIAKHLREMLRARAQGR